MQSLPLITGYGLITPLGADAPTTWDALLRGQTVRTHSHTPVPRCASIERVTQLALRAAREAVNGAGWTGDDLADDGTALVVGTSKGPVEAWVTAPPSTSDNPSNMFGRIDPAGIAQIATGLAPILRLGAGPRLTYSAACASGLHALIRGAMLIRSEQCQRVLVVAGESSVHPLFLGSFERLGVLPREGVGCRPFDEHRDGFLMSEAAAAVCLEAVEPNGMGANPGAVVVDRFALGGDATHLTGGDPEAGLLRHLLARVTDGRPIDLVHAHGTGTRTNDPVELAAIEAVVGSSACGSGERPSLYSHKGALGHSLGAAGLVAIIINCLSHSHGVVPPNAATTAPLEAERVELSKGQRRRRVRRSLAMAAGFGGPTAVVGLTSL